MINFEFLKSKFSTKNTGLFLSICFIIFSIYFFDNINFITIKKILYKTNSLYLFVSIIVFMISYVIASVKFYYVCNLLFDYNISFKDILFMNLASLFFANILPVGPTADIYRVYTLKKKYNFSLEKSLICALIDRICSLFFTLIILYVFLLTYSVISMDKFYVNLLFLLLPLFGFFLLFYFYVDILNLLFRDKIPNYFLLFKENLFFSLINFKIISLSILQIILFGLGVLSISYAVDNFLNFFWLGISPLLLMIQSFPLFFAGWGIRETFILFIGDINVLHYEENVSFSISLCIGVCLFIASFLGFYSFIKNFSSK